MAFRDLREFISALDKTGDVVHIRKEVDWDKEAGAINRRVHEMWGPALLFEKIKDYPDGFRIFGGSLGTFRRVAIALGLPPDTPVREIYDEYERREEHPIKPVVVKDAPCKENIIPGEDVDVYRFPAPMVHEGDGGRYIGTWDIVVSKDPAGEGANWGMYRFMIHNKRHIVGFPRYHSHLARVLNQQYVPGKKPMPMALVLGAEPLCHQAAGTAYGKGLYEAEFAGALRQAPVELVKCETSDLLVPATAEVVIEAEILPDATAMEGPFGEYPGYRTGGTRMAVVARIKAITHRNSPIITMLSLGYPPDCCAVATPIAAALAVKRQLKRFGVPVTAVYTPPEAVMHTLVVSVEHGGKDVAKQILDTLTFRRSEWSKIIMVDDDIDAFNMFQVIHALSVKCHPVNGIITRELEPGKGNPITPCYTPEERSEYRGGIALFDCTWPPDWPEDTHLPVKSDFATIYSEETKRKVIENWEEYGLK